MRVALIHDWLNGMRGAEKVLEALCELYPDAVIFTLFYEPEKISKAISRHEVRASALNRFPIVRRNYRSILPLFPAVVERFDLSQFDLVISSSHCAAKGVKPPSHALHICYCHSPMRYIWDRFDDYFSKAETGALKRLLARGVASRLRRWDVLSSSRVDIFVSNSEFVKGRVQNFYGRPSAVIYPFADTDFYRPAPNARTPLRSIPRGDGDYFLTVSALVPYKRIRDIVEVFSSLDERMIIIGDGPERERLAAMAPPNVEFIGWVSDHKLLEFYRNCRGVIFPGVEDFGIVPVEAQACGKPVIALAEGGALETVDAPLIGADNLDRSDAAGILYREAGAQYLKEAIARFARMSFDSDIIRKKALRFSRQAFLSNMADFISESFARFKSNGRDGIEKQMISVNNAQISESV